MKLLFATMLLAVTVLGAGCSAIEMSGGASARWDERTECERGRSAGVWVAAAGACIRGGGI